MATTSSISVDNGTRLTSSQVSGSTGYGFCKDGNSTASCPFYLGSFSALATSDITTEVACADGSSERLTLSNLSTKLGQPAFGISEVGTSRIGFPAGGMIVDASFDVGATHVTARRPTSQVVVGTASGPSFSADYLTVDVDLPCNDSVGQVRLELSLASPPDGGALSSPPDVVITTPPTVTCGGTTALTASVTDPDSDVAALRWRVDGILMAPTMSTITFTMGHTVEAIATDNRGATTTATRVIQSI